MLINRENLEALFKTYMTAFQEGVKKAPATDVAFMFREFPSTNAANFYAWIDLIPGFREWVDERIFNNVNGRKYEVINRLFECSNSVGRSDILDDTYGVLAPVIQMQAESWPIKKAELVLEALLANPVTYTGTELCGTHKLSSKVSLVNKTTNALTKTSFEAALLAAAEWKFANGELVKPFFTHLLVGEKLRAVAHGIVESKTTVELVKNVLGTENVGAAQLDNPNVGRVQMKVLPDLAGSYDDYWYLLDCSKPIKPIVLQVRENPAPKMDRDPDLVEKNGKADFFATGRAAGAPTFPWLVYGGIL